MKAVKELIEESEKLLALGEEIQDQALSRDERELKLKNLSDRYHDWYYDALALFDADKHQEEKRKFESEYEGSFWTGKIMKFLTSALKTNALYDEGQPNPLIPKWTFSYNRSFKEPLLKQRSLLATLTTASKDTNQKNERDNQWNETLCRLLRVFIDKADSARSNEEKKLTYEYLAIFVIGAINGLTVIQHDMRSAAEEVDLLIENVAEGNFWQGIGNPFIVECKNWATPVGASQIRNIEGIMRSKNIRAALLFSKNGVSGDEYRDAMSLIREALSNGRYIIVLDHADLLEIADGMHPAEKIRQQFYALFKW